MRYDSISVIYFNVSLQSFRSGAHLMLVFSCVSKSRRGYSISSTSNAVVRGRSAGVVKAGEEENKMGVDSNSWVSDPGIGYYKPSNLASDVDVAELRQILLTQKLHQH